MRRGAGPEGRGRAKGAGWGQGEGGSAAPAARLGWVMGGCVDLACTGEAPTPHVHCRCWAPCLAGSTRQRKSIMPVSGGCRVAPLPQTRCRAAATRVSPCECGKLQAACSCVLQMGRMPLRCGRRSQQQQTRRQQRRAGSSQARPTREQRRGRAARGDRGCSRSFFCSVLRLRLAPCLSNLETLASCLLAE